MTKIDYSYDRLHRDIQSLHTQIVDSSWIPTVVVGICRGGLLPAILMSYKFNVPMKAFNLSLRDQTLFGPDQATWLPDLVSHGHRILVVDDINDSGATIAWIREHWQQVLNSPINNHVRVAVLLDKQTSHERVDYSATTIPPENKDIWWVFPWEPSA